MMMAEMMMKQMIGMYDNDDDDNQFWQSIDSALVIKSAHWSFYKIICAQSLVLSSFFFHEIDMQFLA